MAYDLQKIMMDNYVKKNNIEVESKRLSKDGSTWFYNLKPIMIDGEKCYPYITAKIIFPDKFDNEKEYNHESTFNEYN